jgi:hypothetical protein
MTKLPVLLNTRQSEFLRDLLHTINNDHILDFLVDNDSLDDCDVADLLRQLEIMDPEYFFGVNKSA